MALAHVAGHDKDHTKAAHRLIRPTFFPCLPFFPCRPARGRPFLALALFFSGRAHTNKKKQSIEKCARKRNTAERNLAREKKRGPARVCSGVAPSVPPSERA